MLQDQYLNFSSENPVSLKVTGVKTLVQRERKCCSSDEIYQLEKAKIFADLKYNGCSI